jgi:hypothetical protein
VSVLACLLCAPLSARHHRFLDRGVQMALAAGGVRAGGLALVQPPMESRKGAGGAEQILQRTVF